MFPLGRCALPGETVPLRIFEPRYLEMVERVEAGSGEFGIVLISRGWEVGGGDDRFAVATSVRIVRDVPLGDDQRAIVALALRRVSVVEWLDEAPYPRALVSDAASNDTPNGLDLAPHLRAVRRLYALASELGADVAAVELTTVEDSSSGLWKLASLVPLAELDRQRLLETSEVAERSRVLGAMIDDAIQELELRLGQGG